MPFEHLPDTRAGQAPRRYRVDRVELSSDFSHRRKIQPALVLKVMEDQPVRDTGRVRDVADGDRIVGTFGKGFDGHVDQSLAGRFRPQLAGSTGRQDGAGSGAASGLSQ